MTDLPAATIAELLQEIEKRDETAVTRLYQHYHDFLFAFIRHQLPNDADAEEVTQDVLMAVCKKPRAFRGQAKFSTWLCSIAKNKIADLRRKQGSKLVRVDADDEALQELPDPNWDFVAQIEAEEDEEALRHCIDALSPKQKEVIFWIYNQSERLKSVAQRLSIAEGTVKSTHSKARQLLHDCMSRWMQRGRHA